MYIFKIAIEIDGIYIFPNGLKFRSENWISYLIVNK